MAILELLDPFYAAIAVASLLVGVATIYYQSRPAWPAKAPKLVRGWPFLGSLGMWTERVDWHDRHTSASPTGNFSYFIGSKPVVAVSGKQGRKIFFESSKLDMNKGFAALFAGSPTPPQAPTEGLEDFGTIFSRRLVAMLKREQFNKLIPHLVHDTQDRLADLVDRPSGLFDPFEDIYKIVFQLTMRTVGCKEAASDRALLDKTLRTYELIEAGSTPTVIMFPWLPSLGKLKRLYGGAQLYFTFDKLVKARIAEGRREDDPMQFLMDQGDNTVSIITFVMGALFAGQINSGVNAAWILMFLAANPEWRTAAYREIEAVAGKYDSDTTKSLPGRLASVPLEGWENDFPIGEACLRDSIRLNLNGTTFRKNASGAPVAISNGEVIPPEWYATYALSDTHHDPALYPDPFKWNPGRYVTLDGKPSPENPLAKDPHSFLGWGTGRHPCLGMKFAKLEQNVIVAFFLAMFDFELADKERGLPKIDFNAVSAKKPEEKAEWIRYWPRDQARPVGVAA